MSRLYSRKKGKAGSKKPLNPTKPSWVRVKPKEIEMLVAKLAKAGKSTSEIGLILRDSYGVPDVKLLTGKRIAQIVKEKKLTPKIPEDLLALITRTVAIKSHMEKNHKDQTALRGWQLTNSKIKRLVRYYKSTQQLPLDWKLDEHSLRMYVE